MVEALIVVLLLGGVGDERIKVSKEANLGIYIWGLRGNRGFDGCTRCFEWLQPFIDLSGNIPILPRLLGSSRVHFHFPVFKTILLDSPKEKIHIILIYFQPSRLVCTHLNFTNHASCATSLLIPNSALDVASSFHLTLFILSSL